MQEIKEAGSFVHVKHIMVVLGIIIYIFLGGQIHYWINGFADRAFGGDFSIYWDAVLAALSNENPYLPYEIGYSFIYPPFSLSLISLFSVFSKYEIIKQVWILINIFAFVGAVFVSLFIQSHFLQGKEPFKVGGIKSEIITFIALLSFAPVWETFILGQINALPFLFIALALKAHLQERPWRSGIWLALAILLKISPLILLGYFAARLRWREILSTLLTLLLTTAIAALQFGFDIVEQFLQILPWLSTEIHPASYNQSVLAITYRVAALFAIPVSDETLIWAHKLLFMATLGLILGVILWKTWRGHVVSPWFFAALLAVVIFFSPLLWFHHALFLTLPLVLLLNYNQKTFTWGAGILLLFQVNRLFEGLVFYMALPAMVGGVALIFVCLWLAFESKRSPTSIKN